MSRLAFALLLAASPLQAQWCGPTRICAYAQVWFENGGATLYRDSGRVVVTIGSGSNARRGVRHEISPLQAGSLALLLIDGRLPAREVPITIPWETGSVTYRCLAGKGCWAVIVNAGMGSYFRPDPPILPAHFLALAQALIAARDGVERPSTVIDLR